ncbi:hypothetical protein [Granulicella arctica]|uniref:hypothetical protein n=1 Tax=Granulicella arctica TaxID=940613 RepID=UPI0021E0A340|nr:hypothetical protein [Granulicella arctica]
MRDTSLFLPDAIEDALRSNLESGLRSLADAIASKQLDGTFLGSIAAAGGRNDDRIHLRITIDVAAPILRSIVSSASTLKLTE